MPICLDAILALPDMCSSSCLAASQKWCKDRSILSTQKDFFPLINMAASSTYMDGGAYGLAIMCLMIETLRSPLVRATECLHPASIDLETEVGSEQYPLHWMTLVALCC